MNKYQKCYLSNTDAWKKIEEFRDFAAGKVILDCGIDEFTRETHASIFFLFELEMYIQNKHVNDFCNKYLNY